jgi:hypothetical protein
MPVFLSSHSWTAGETSSPQTGADFESMDAAGAAARVAPEAGDGAGSI